MSNLAPHGETGHARNGFELLVIESNARDAILLAQALEAVGLREHIGIAVDGEDASLYLRRESLYDEAPVPDLIFLVWRGAGHPEAGTLVKIRRAAQLRSIPVIVLLGSDDAASARRACASEASCVMLKPHDLSQFIRHCQHAFTCWIDMDPLEPREAIAS
jgi:chemotaxis family two-component system response regulator Rcp1